MVLLMLLLLLLLLYLVTDAWAARGKANMPLTWGV
jgi:hypothetical protein